MTEVRQAQIERTEGLDLMTGPDAVWDVNGPYWSPERETDMTIDNRGEVVHLRRNQRLIFGDQIWYGLDVSAVTLRVWHDGSVTVEMEYDRSGHRRW